MARQDYKNKNIMGIRRDKETMSNSIILQRRTLNIGAKFNHILNDTGEGKIQGIVTGDYDRRKKCDFLKWLFDCLKYIVMKNQFLISDKCLRKINKSYSWDILLDSLIA